VSSEEDRHRLVPHLRVGHRLTPLVTGLEQERQQVAAPGVRATLREQPVDRQVKAAARGAHPARPGQREALERAVEREHEALERLHRVGEGRPDLGRLGLDVGRKQRPPHERQAGHLLVQVAFLAVAPASLQAVGAFDHLSRVPSDAAPVEERLHQPALMQVERALARQQPLAEDPLGLLERLALHKRTLLCNKHLLDEVRVVEQILVPGSPTEAGDIAVLRGHARQRADGISIEGDDRRPRDSLTRAGRVSEHTHARKAMRARPYVNARGLFDEAGLSERFLVALASAVVSV
jgi:hypothetical protein